MPTLTYIEGFEHGVMGEEGGGICAAHSVPVPPIATAIKRTGAYSMRANPTVGTYYFSLAPLPATPTVLVARFYVYFTTWPGADALIWRAVPTAGVNLYLQFVQADKTLRTAISTTYGTKSAVLSLDTWYQVDIKADVSANPNTLDLQVGGVDAGQITYAQAATTIAQFGYGVFTGGSTCDMYYDDIIHSQTAGDYPLGAGTVVALRPSVDGTHNFAVDALQDNASVDINASTNPAWGLLDDALWDSLTDYVKQVTIAAGDYAEVAFEDTAETVIQGARAFLAYHGLGAGSNNAQARIRDGAGQETTVFSGPWNNTALWYKAIQVTIPAAGWTTATVNALLARIGYSGDVTDVPAWDAVMLQVACGVASGSALIKVINE